VREWEYTTADPTTLTTPVLAHTVPSLIRRGTASNFIVHAARTGRERTDALFDRYHRVSNEGLAEGQVEELVRAEGLLGVPWRDLWREVAGEAAFLDREQFARFIARARRTDFESDREVVIRIETPPRFRLPQDASCPVVMFAAGTGISPFRAFWQRRAARGSGMNLLYFSTTTSDELYLREELEAAELAGKLRTRITFTRASLQARLDPDRRRFVFEPGAPRRIGALLEEEREAAHLYRLLLAREHGGIGGHFYVCGRAGFARSVIDSLRRIIQRFHPRTLGSHEPDVEALLPKLVAQNRLSLDVFTTHSSRQALTPYRWSDLCLRNDPRYGYWILVSGRIIDLTEFRLLHPGGVTILDNYAGLDATSAYRSVGHHDQAEVQSMTSMYEIGRMEPIGLPPHPAGRRPDGSVCELTETLDVWLNALSTVTQLENIQRNDYSLQDKPLSSHFPSSLHTQQAILAHERSQNNAVKALFGPVLKDLWNVTIAISGVMADTSGLERKMARIRETPAASARDQLVANLWAWYDAVPRDPAAPSHATLRDALAELRHYNSLLLRDFKLAIRDGVLRFENAVALTMGTLGTHLVATLERLPALLELYQNGIAPIADRAHAGAAGQLVESARVAPVTGRSLLDVVDGHPTDGFAVQICAAGEMVIVEGEIGDAAYLVEEGRCEAFRVVDGHRDSFRIMGPGHVFGEIALLNIGRRTASVVALENNTRLRVIRRTTFVRDLESSSPWVRSLIQSLAARLRILEEA
jgi:ferredoxin-NADP reductase